jgi:hypothetical protein
VVPHKKKIVRLRQTMAKRMPRSPIAGQQAQGSPRNSSFLDQLFGRKPKPKRKTLFGF